MENYRSWNLQDGKEWCKQTLAPLDEKLADPAIPLWMRDLSAFLSEPGLEIHCARWLEGLDIVLYSIRDGGFYRAPFGRYGDAPAAHFQRIDRYTRAVADWLDRRTPEDDLARTVHELLGPSDETKREAARCFVEITRLHVDQEPAEAFLTAGESWREKAKANPLLELIFQGEGLDRGLNDGAGFWYEQRLLTVLRLIGGQQDSAEDLLGSCNYQLRHVFRDDPERMRATRGYIAGVHAYLEDLPVQTVRDRWPNLAGYALSARACLIRAKLDEQAKQLIASKLLVFAQFWYIRALTFAIKDEVCDEDWLVPGMHSNS